jgi:cupin 2 domain-containing protein
VNRGNIFAQIPGDLRDEVFEALVQERGVTVERIISRGHTSPPSGWYDQQQHEWVMVLQGEASIAFDDGSVIRLVEGDYLTIPAHCRHRVIHTCSSTTTVWLAVHY